ncbi:MAG: tetratricopeptide repeat protein [Nitrospirota bacterium]|nr:tetratricopeptide repeat protein [Nitrospirota bacterium]
MASKSEIRLTSKRSPEFGSDIRVNDVTYHVQTEDMGIKTCKIVTNIYLKGEIVHKRKSDYAHLTKLADFADRLTSLMEKQHKSAIDQFIAEKSERQKPKSDYFEEVQQLLRRGNGKSAMTSLRHALEKFPGDPFLLSYYGYLLAVIENKPKEGIKICEDALGKLKKSMPFGSEFFYPAFYLNLGRAYLKDDRKKEAVEAFQDGLKIDPENHDILWEIKKLGTRKKPPLTFLSRSNPINIYLGKLLNKPSKK